MYTIRYAHSLTTIWFLAIFFLYYQTSFAQSADNCQVATPISIGTCDFPVDVLASYANSRPADDACAGAPVNVDGWLSFTTTIANERLLLEFESLNKDAAIAVYSGTCPTPLTSIACADAVNGIGTERVEFDAPTAATYYIRLMNVEDASTLNGLLCLSRVFSRDNCADMLTAPSIETGNCNVRINVLSTFNTATDCLGNNRPASWIKFTAATTEDIRIDYLANSTARIPNIALYNSVGFDCATTPTLITCANTTNNLASLTASVTAGTDYYLKIVNTDLATDMLGQLCVYPANAATDPVGFFSALSPVINACTQFNVLTGFGNANEGLISNAASNCLPNDIADFNSDAWIKFENLAAADEIFIDYDNTNGETSLPDDAALVIYKGENITTFDAAGYQEASCFAVSGSFVRAQINQVLTNITIGNGTATACDGNAVETGVAWFQLDAPGEPFSLTFFDNNQATNQQIDIEIYAGGCAATGANLLCGATLTTGAGFSILEVESASIYNAGAGVPLYIKVINESGTPLTGSLGIFGELTPLACVNTDIEAIESIKISTELAGFEANHTYYVRIANVSNGGNESLFGTLCVRDQEILPTDLCTTALGLNQGDCGISLPIPLNRDQLQVNAEATLCPPINKTITRDVWAKFTAASTSTTIEYLNNNTDGTVEDVIISVYRGSCGNNQTLGTLVREVCQDNLGNAVGIETVQLNTIPGLQYFIRISTNATTPVDGRICLQNTNQVNVCEVENLNTIFVSDCNYRFDIPADFTLDGSNIVNRSVGLDINLSVTYPDARDAWLRMLGNGQTVTLQYQNNSEAGLEASNPAIVVYTSSPDVIDCSVGLNGAGNPNNEILYVNLFDNTNKQTETVSFPTNAGQTYFIRLIDLAPAAVNSRGMTGNFCLSAGNQTTFNTCPTPISIDIGTCNVRLNVTDGISTFDGPTETCSGNLITGVADSWAVVTTPVPPVSENLPENFITIQYDNSGGSLFPVSDIAIAVYTDCNDLAGSLMGCVDDLTVVNGINVEGIESIQIPIDAATGGETFYIRVINKTPQNTSFGKLCIFYGEDITNELCTNASDYGDVRSGEWKSIEIQGDWNTVVPTTSILESACVIPGGASPTSANPPIRSQGWFRFTVPDGDPSIDNEVGIVTIQYDNEDFVEGNPENAAIAVYSSPNNDINNVNCALLSGYNGSNDPRVFANPNTDYTAPNGLYFLGCTNTVWEGTETMTIPVLDGRTYYVRVMNVANRTNPNDMPGRIRIFPFAKCTEGENLVKDGTFQNWGAMDRSAEENPTAYPQIDVWNHPNPGFANYGAAPTAGLTNLIDYARFASAYGYLRDRGSDNNNTSLNRNRHANLQAVRNELATEGLYTVTHTANTYKGNWFCYGRGYSGYGGNNATGSNTWNATYCAAGGEGVGLEACEATCVTYDQNGTCLQFSAGNFGQPTAGSPSIIPSTAEANFMLINGLWTDPNLNPNAAKIWCQTITRPNESLNSVGYYVFRAWFQNVKSGRQSGDVPQLKISICDMADPNDPELIPDNSQWATLTPTTGNQILLPGVTRIAGEGPSPTGQTSHIPPPPNLQNMTIPADGNFRYEYGAAMSCNAEGEADNARLKTLGSSFFVEQSPDTWQLMRCIYRAPRDVVEFNLCIENESLSKNGNDFAIDDISLAECTDANEAAFDRLLKGDACELADNAEFLGLVPLNVTLIDFSGKLFTEYVILDWITIQEVGAAYFEVERSLNGRDFSKVGTVDASGTSDETKVYSFIDQNLPEDMPFVYYRLKIYDQTAHFKHSAVIQIDLGAMNEIEVKLFPNPVVSGEVAKLQFMAPQDRASIVIADMVGNPLYQTSFMTIEGLNEIELDTQGLPQGIYIISLAQGTRRIAKKLVVR